MESTSAESLLSRMFIERKAKGSVSKYLRYVSSRVRIFTVTCRRQHPQNGPFPSSIATGILTCELESNSNWETSKTEGDMCHIQRHQAN